MCISHRPIFITTLCATLRQLLEVGRSRSHFVTPTWRVGASQVFCGVHTAQSGPVCLQSSVCYFFHHAPFHPIYLLSLLSIQIQHQPRAASRHAGIVNHDHDHLSDIKYPYPGIHVVVRLDEADVGALSHHLFSNHECRMNASISRMHYQWI